MVVALVREGHANCTKQVIPPRAIRKFASVPEAIRVAIETQHTQLRWPAAWTVDRNALLVLIYVEIASSM